MTTAAYAIGIEPRWFALRRLTVPVLRPRATRSLRLLHLSDLHLQPRHRPLRRFLEHCEAEDPDVVVVTGDILDHPDVVGPAVDLLRDLRRDRPGVFVLGSHDRYCSGLKNPFRYLRRRRAIEPKGSPQDTALLVEGLKGAGWHFADNRRLRLDSPAGPIEVLGQGDAHIRADRPEAVDWAPPGDDVALALGVAHSPYLRVLDRLDRAGLDLAVAGHTHGGQVRVPGLGALVNNCDLPLSQTRGLSGYGAGLTLHVSGGLGASRHSPFRFACRPEATLLDLVPRPTEL